jgi:hypothetical protein
MVCGRRGGAGFAYPAKRPGASKITLSPHRLSLGSAPSARRPERAPDVIGAAVLVTVQSLYLGETSDGHEELRALEEPAWEISQGRLCGELVWVIASHEEVHPHLHSQARIIYRQLAPLPRIWCAMSIRDSEDGTNTVHRREVRETSI